MDIHFQNGERYQVIAASVLETLETEIRNFVSSSRINDFQRWIVDDLYCFTPPEADFSIESILLVAVPHPFYSEVTFQHHQKRYHCVSLVRSDFERTRNTLKRELSKGKFSFLEVESLPLKRLAVQSGLAVYGRNNITYIPEFGSNFSYIAFYSDLPPAVSSLSPVQVSTRCETCRACMRVCPTGAIQADAFLIDNERCLSYLNESSGPFPDWLPVSAHHTLYDCIQCQKYCPLNVDQKNNTGRRIEFSEAETDILLAGASFDDYPKGLKEKSLYLGMDQWPDGIAKNLKVLIDRDDAGIESTTAST
ncbi:MAG: 4Fe-4S double cluster binding domain-containing protein [Anaerolineales bacterium]